MITFCFTYVLDVVFPSFIQMVSGNMCISADFALHFSCFGGLQHTIVV